jgi:4-methylaminobutanoate oxidase (formaldehyde-forming)
MSVQTVVIIGGGVIGLSTAYQLASKGTGRVVLLDKGKLGEGSSARAAGIGTHLVWSETGIRARKIGFRLFRQFSEEWDDYKFHNEHGCLNLFTPDAWPARTPLLPLYDQLDVPYEVLSAAEIRHRWPDLHPPEGFVGLFDPRAGYSEPSEYIAALTRRVRELGVEIYEGEPVVEFLRQGDRVTGVRTPQRTVEADAVVSTVHVWSLPLWCELPLRLPMKHFVHQRYVTVPLDKPLVAPAVNADPYSGYVRPAAGNRVLMGIETTQREEFRVPSREFVMDELNVPQSVRDEGQRNFVDFAPALRDAAWESQHVGLISYTSDGEPVLGPVPQLPGLFVAASFHSGGFSYNAVAGQLMAEWVVDGKTSIDTTAFLPSRFSAEATERHLATTVPQAEAVRRRH